MKQLLALIMLIVCSTTAFAIAATGTEIQQNLPSDYEPSGIVWHPYYNALFVVSDEGILSRMNVYGSEVTSWTIGGDLEGVTVANPASPYVYVVTEYPMAITEFNPETGTVVRTWPLNGIVPSPSSTNSALEAIAYIPNEDSPYQSSFEGVFLVGMQGDGKVYALDLGTTATLLASYTPVSRSDLADMYYNDEENILYILYDSADLLRKVYIDGTLVSEESVSGNAQEGITLLPACPAAATTLFIAEDTGRVMKYEGYATTCPATPPTDSDSDGVPDTSDVCNGYNDADDMDNDSIPDGCDTSDDRDNDSDGLTNAQELVYGTNPDAADTDGDALLDGEEVLTYFTSPTDSDSDNGGVLDGQEIANSTNPLDSSDDVLADPYLITGYTVNADATVLVQYADNTQLTIDPFPGYTQINAGLNSNSDRLIVTNGKYVNVYKRDMRIAHVKIAKRIPTSNTMTVTNAGSYDLIVVQYPHGRKTVTVTLTLENDILNIISAVRRR